MMKTIEVVIAIVLLFFFVMFIIQNFTKPSTDIDLKTRTVEEMLLTKADNNDFQQLINNDNVADIYDDLSNDMETNFAIRLCSNLNNTSCEGYGTVPTDTPIKTVDYYFGIYNKTLSVIFWIK